MVRRPRALTLETPKGNDALLCFRCGSYNQDGTPACNVCGQAFSSSTGPAAALKNDEKTASKAHGLFSAGDLIAGRYRVKSVIGQGGVGVVYRVHDEEIDTDVALKAIAPNLLQTEDERALFSKQMKQARKLHHRNIIRIYDEGHDGERRFFTMKLLEGLTLRKIIRLRHDKGQSFTTEEIVPIFHQLASALDYAHKSTWHGDLKPENIIILPDLLKVTDFNLIRAVPLKPFLGIAKSKNKGFEYIAPEIRVEASRIDGRVDVYAMGVIACEMITGILFEGHFSRRISAVLEELPPRLDGLIRRALAEHPEGRFAKASDFAAELEEALTEIPGGQLPPPPAPRAETETALRRRSKAPPPPPAETNPAMMAAPQMSESTAEDRPAKTERSLDDDVSLDEEKSDVSLEEIGQSQVILLETGMSQALGDARGRPPALVSVESAEGIGGILPRRKHSEETSLEDAMSNQDEAGRRTRAEDELFPPPLPPPSVLESSNSFDSLPRSVLALTGDSNPSISAEGEPEPTVSGVGEKVGIHDDLTALKSHPRPDLLDVPPDDDDEHDEIVSAEELAASRARSAKPAKPVKPAVPPALPPSLEGVAPELRPVTPPRDRRQSTAPMFVAGIALAVVVVTGAVFGWRKYGGGDDAKKAIPVAHVGHGPIGAPGGKVTFGGLEVRIPAGALEAETDVKLARTLSVTVPPDYESLSDVFRFEPAGTDFKKPVTVLMPFNGDGDGARLLWSSDGASFQEIEGRAEVGRLIADVSHFSYGFVGKKRATVVAVNADAKPVDEAGAGKVDATSHDDHAAKTEPPASTAKAEADAQARAEAERRELERVAALEREREREDADRRAREEMEARERADRERKEAEAREKEERAREEREAKAREAEERKLAAKTRAASTDKPPKEKPEPKKEPEKVASVSTGTECAKGMKLIEAGTFVMGSSPSDSMRNFGEKLGAREKTGNYCIDYYEYPNGKQTKPSVGVSWSQAKMLCERKGKRLCTEAEWERACKGPGDNRFSYGNNFDPGACNTEDASGNPRDLGTAVDFKKCRSGYNVFALSGNAEEWTADSFRAGASSRVVKGGAADRPDWASRCAARRGLAPNTKKSTLGFRCCADPR